MHVTILHRTRECNTHHFELHGGGGAWMEKEANEVERGRETGRERDARVVETLTCFLAPERFPFSRVENSSTSCRGYSPSERYSEGRREREREWNFHLT